MTDEHGADSQPTHEEVPGEEHTVPEAETGVWSDDQPPVDDFSDSGATVEESATVTQEAATETEESTMPSAEPARSMLPLFAGIGGILLLGVVLYWQFGHSPPPSPAMTLPTAAPKSSSTLASTDTKLHDKEAPASKNVETTDIASLYKSAPEQAAPATSETTPTTSMGRVPETMPAPPPSLSPAAPATTAPSPTVPADVVPVASSPVVSAPPPADTRIDTLTTHINDLQNSMNQATQQISQLANMVAANQAMPPVSSQTNPALEDRLNKIEQNLMQLEHAKTTKPTTASSITSEESPPEAKAVSHTVKPSAKHKHKTKKPKTVRHKSQPVIAAQPESSSSLWVLRAATPTEAWVASDSRTTELRHVQVGDSLSGIGQVRAIRQTRSGWEIQGTGGTVR